MIRNATVEDLQEIVRIEQASQSHGWTPQQLAEELERSNGHMLVAIADKSVIGFVVGWSVAQETHILDVAVCPSRRRTGIGRALVNALLRACGNPVALLEVRASNGAARRLYESLGFQIVGKRENYYKDGEGALLMTLDSTNPEVIFLGKG